MLLLCCAVIVLLCYYLCCPMYWSCVLYQCHRVLTQLQSTNISIYLSLKQQNNSKTCVSQPPERQFWLPHKLQSRFSQVLYKNFIHKHRFILWHHKHNARYKHVCCLETTASALTDALRSHRLRTRKKTSRCTQKRPSAVPWGTREMHSVQNLSDQASCCWLAHS